MYSMNARVSEWLHRKSVGVVERDENGIPVMTEKTVRCLALENGGYECEEINDKLYLHFQGFKSIGGLEKYTGVKCLYLESNGLTNVSGLSHLSELRSLFLQQNLIRSIARPAFDGLVNVVTIDISQNLLCSLEGISCLRSLQSLNASKNRIKEVSGLSELKDCEFLSSVDLRGNLLDEHEALLELLQECTNLSAIYLSGNPSVKSMKHYRKEFISRFPKLTYLDERPVDDKERMLAEAWCEGGREAEQLARERWHENEKKKTENQIRSWNSFKARTIADRQAEIEKAREEGRDLPPPKQYVSYRTVDATEEDRRQGLIRELAVAEAEAERISKFGGGLQLLNLKNEEELQSKPVATSEPNGSECDSTAGAEIPLPTEVRPPSPTTKNPESDLKDLLTSEQQEENLRQWRIEESLRLHSERKLRKLKANSNSTAQDQVNEILEGHEEADKVGLQTMSKTVNSSNQSNLKNVLDAEEGLKPSELATLDDEEVSRLVREYVFDFTKVANFLSEKNGTKVSGEAVRLHFAALRAKVCGTESVSQKPANARIAAVKSGKSESEKQERGVSAVHKPMEEVYGIPMPKVSLKRPSDLPSMRESENDIGYREVEDYESSPLESKENPICEFDDLQFSADPTIDRARNPFNDKLSRREIIASLHGTPDHPLADATYTDNDERFFELD